MSIIAFKKKSLTLYSKNHSIGNDGFSVWSSTNSGNYNGSRIISGFSAVQTPFKGTVARGNIYVAKGGGSYPYSNNIVENCTNTVCKKYNTAVLNTNGLLNKNLRGIKHGKLNVVKQFNNNNNQDEYIFHKKKQINVCYQDTVDKPDIEEQLKNDFEKNCDTASIRIGNGRQILVGSFSKTGKLAKQSLDSSDYIKSRLMKNKCLDHNTDSRSDLRPKIRLSNNTLISSNMINTSSFRSNCHRGV